MSDRLLAFVVGLGLALVLGYFVARKSNREDEVLGGLAAQVFHYLGAAAITGVLLVVLVSLILGNGFLFSFPLAVGFMMVGWLALLAYAVVEEPMRARMADGDRGWTSEDARASGL